MASKTGRGHLRLLLLLMPVVLLAPLVAACSSGPTGAASASGRSPSSLLVLRKEGKQVTVWRLNGGKEEQIAQLPGQAALAAVSPDSKTVAYLPMRAGRVLWLLDDTGQVKTLQLSARGLRVIDALTWISPSQVVLSGGPGTKGAEYYSDTRSERDRLYILSVATGTVKPFRNIRGTEPSAAPDAGKMTYVSFTNPRPYMGDKSLPGLDENLVLLNLEKKGAGQVVITGQIYVGMMRYFGTPQLASDGRNLLTRETYTDTSISYSLRDSQPDWGLGRIGTTSGLCGLRHSAQSAQPGGGLGLRREQWRTLQDAEGRRHRRQPSLVAERRFGHSLNCPHCRPGPEPGPAGARR